MVGGDIISCTVTACGDACVRSAVKDTTNHRRVPETESVIAILDLSLYEAR